MIKQLFSRLMKRRFLPRRILLRWLKGFVIRFAERAANIIALFYLSSIVIIALAANLLASSRPLACSLDGSWHILPGVFSGDQSQCLDNETIHDALGAAGNWALLPPIPYGPNQTKTFGNVSLLEAPSARHWLGTDDKGRDVLARMVYGARSAMLVGLGSVALYLLLAILLGAVAGYFGGLADRIALRFIETLTAFPSFFLILALQGLLGTTSLTQLILIIGLTRWTDVARLTRGEVLRIVNEDYVFAARALGLGHTKILLRHVLPSAIGPALVAATFGVAGAILIESTLSFLGFGVPPTTPSWGQLLTDAFYNEGAYWLSIFPGMILFLTIVSINLVGEGFREALDPA